MPVTTYRPSSDDQQPVSISVVDEAVRQLQSSPQRCGLAPVGKPLTLPEPVFPRYPDRVGDVPPPAKYLPQPGNA
jgi:hypothetical protein